ncbi:MAG TPA: hypothetical protein VEV17_10815 [Bryobacteraceae bacterium]|nr:hypothetical protein [Bryobacteraceae bacterium]
MANGGELLPKFDPRRLQARWILGKTSAEELVTQALIALQHGYSGNALQQLAGLTNPTLSDLGTLPDRAVAELGLPVISKEQAMECLVRTANGAISQPISRLLKAFPAFSARWQEHVADWGDEPAGAYNDMAEFVHFVIDDLHEKGNLDEVRRVFHLIEELLVGSDQDTRNLIGFGFFETLQNVASWRPGGYEQFEPYLGLISREIWGELQRIWAGKSSLADVIRAEREHG